MEYELKFRVSTSWYWNAPLSTELGFILPNYLQTLLHVYFMLQFDSISPGAQRGRREAFYISLQNKLTFYLSEPPMNYYLYALSRLHLFDPPINIQNWVRVRSQACAYLINERPAALPTESQLYTIGKHRTPCAQSKSHKKISACVQLVQFTWQQGK